MSNYLHRQDNFVFQVGYDQILKYAFMTIQKEDGELVFSNLDYEDGLDHQDFGHYAAIALERFGVRLPDWLIRAVNADAGLLELFGSNTVPSDLMRPLPEYGCYVRVLDDVLYFCPTDRNGDAVSCEELPVTHPESQAFLDAVNTLFHTSFSLEQFSPK